MDPPHTSRNRIIDVYLGHDRFWQIQLLGEFDDEVVVEQDVDEITKEGNESWSSAFTFAIFSDVGRSRG